MNKMEHLCEIQRKEMEQLYEEQRKERERAYYWCSILGGIACGIYFDVSGWVSGNEPFTWLSVVESCAMLALGSLIVYAVLWLSFRTWWKA